MAGLEVSSLKCVGEEFEGIKVAQVEEISPHPNADKLSLCRICDGKSKFRVVCGAKNMKAGDKVAFAPVGTKLPNGLKIKASKIRGIVSEGMLCSEEELKLEEKSTGIMILPSESETGKDLAQALNLKDYVLELDLTPNRADCFSMIGIAREVAALFNTTFSLPPVEVVESEEDLRKFINVTIEAPDLCPRYTARYVSNVKIQPSPLWMRRRLELAGIRSINNVVDVTNYILLEWGQPMHAFDYSLLDQGRIIVKKAAKGDKFFTLDGKERILDEETLMICDASKYIAIGGIMGGLNTEVTEETETVLLESAYFNPQNIRLTSRKLGIKTESSSRFEKGVNIETVITALNRAARLIAKLANGKVAKGVVDVYPNPIPGPPKIEFRPRKANLILGTEISAEKMVGYLERLEIEVKAKDKETFLATIPSHRGDLREEIDLIEEIARIHGYDKIPVTLPDMMVAAEEGKLTFKLENKARSVLTDSGFFEIITYSFISPESIEALKVPEDHPFRRYTPIANPLSREQSIMRTTLLPGLLMTVAENHNHKNMNLKLFELGKVFYQEEKNSLPTERLMLGGVICGLRTEESWNLPREEADFYDLKGAIENLFQALFIDKVKFQTDNSIPYLHTGIASRIIIKEDPLGVIGEIHPHVLDYFEISKKIFVFEIDFGKIISYGDKERKKLKPLPKFPPVYRDIALVVDMDIKSHEIEEVITQSKVRYLQEVKVFDVYQGAPIPVGKKSLAYRLKFQSPDRSLTDEEVNAHYEKILSHLTKKLEVELRS
jgi:phenylalanyl-tRNA synthetase beta chain